MKDKRLLIDKVLSECCDYFGVTWSDLHDEAFCVQHKLGHWLYIWYSEYDHIPTSVYMHYSILMLLKSKEVLERILVMQLKLLIQKRQQ